MFFAAMDFQIGRLSAVASRPTGTHLGAWRKVRRATIGIEGQAPSVSRGGAIKPDTERRLTFSAHNVDLQGSGWII
jgi:hypothetical protein